MTDKSSIKTIRREKFLIEGLACAGCAAKIEAGIKRLDGVTAAELNLATGFVYVTGENLSGMEKKIQEIADRIEPGLKIKKEFTDTGNNREIAVSQETTGGKERKLRIINFLGLITFISALVLFEYPLLDKGYPLYLEYLIYGASFLMIGGSVIQTAIRNSLRGYLFDENFLMTIATLGAFAIKEFPEGVAVMLFYRIGELLQNRAVAHSRSSIKELMNIKPEFANLKKENELIKVPPISVEVGEEIIVRPGERIPLDGIVIKGKARLDTSSLTGESLPRRVSEGDEVQNGVINLDGLLTIRVTRKFNNSTVSRILELVENATSRKAPTEQFITRFARYYTPVIVFIALVIAFFPPLFIQEASFNGWIYRALIFLVVSCPCALVISIPLGFFGGIGRASRQGILVKGGNYLEALNHLEKIVFDKTGTITKGVLAVTGIVGYQGYDKEEVLEYAAYAEAHSNHPVARAICSAYGKKIPVEQITDYQEIPGRGIQACINNQVVLVGNDNLLKENGVEFEPALLQDTVIYVSVGGNYAGYLTINDEVKSDTARTVQELKRMGFKDLTILSGDREETVLKVSREAGFDNYYAGLLPDEKVARVESLLAATSERGKLAFIGDGINDAPVLARSDIGIAMGGLGSDAAIEAADIVILTDEPSRLITAIQTARITRRIVWQNIIMAFGVKGVVLSLGLFGMATMWEAVFADVGVALLAVLNSLRIIRE